MGTEGDQRASRPGSPNSQIDEHLKVSVDELISSTVRALSAQKEGISKRDLAALIPAFDGNPDNNIEMWFNRIEIVQETYEVDDHTMYLVTVGKLTDFAQRWYNSKADHAALNFEELKQHMLAMFSCKEDLITTMKKFEARRWRKSEKFNQYFQDKVVLGNRIGLADKELIHYIIDGFDQPALQSQAKMKQFTSLNELLTIMNEITPAERGIHPTSVKKPTPPSQSVVGSLPAVRCYNCNLVGHVASSCRRPKRERGSCYNCGSMGHLRKDCPKIGQTTSKPLPDSTMGLIQSESCKPAYVVSLEIPNGKAGQCRIVEAVVDTGSPISLVAETEVPPECWQPYERKSTYSGINNCELIILGIYSCKTRILDLDFNLDFYIVPQKTMRHKFLLGRDFISSSDYSVTFVNNQVVLQSKSIVHKEFMSNEILLIDTSSKLDEDLKLENVNRNIGAENVEKLKTIFFESYVIPPRPEKPDTDFEMKIVVKPDHSPFYFRPRRLSYFEKNESNKIIDELLSQGIIRKSASSYSSPIVLVKKKCGSLRMCVDYRELNKITIRDNFPLPLIDDLLDSLRGNKYFTRLDLKNAFHHVSLNEESIKYTSFVTPNGQFEYVKMPFGLKNSPSVFMRFINAVFRDLLYENKIIIYVDDILIATPTVDDNLSILAEVFNTLVQNLLTLRLDKCQFLMTEISYLGYSINEHGIKPNIENIKTIQNFPVPRNIKEVHSFVGLASYFRRFIKNFSIMAKPLYDLLRKNVNFSFNEEALNAFEKIKSHLVSEPLLAIYCPNAETQLHCDASSLGFGAILLQKQNDGLFHPISYYSKRTTENEAKYHSFELETLAIVYALKRFRIYLQGIVFKIFTDCNSLKATLDKKDVNSRILRWSLILHNFTYTIEHRPGDRMRHVDALSRQHHEVLILSDNPFERNLAIKQDLDADISKIRKSLEKSESKCFELRNGVVYRKKGDQTLFYVPETMETNVIFKYHNDLGHVGLDRTIELITRTYWFPRLRDKVKSHIENCLKCISFSPVSGKAEGLLHCIPKGNLPFQCIHIDHYGPLQKTRFQNKYIFLVVDAFTKFIKLYACRTTNHKEAIKHLKSYFSNYSKPIRLIADRGSAFTSQAFRDFVKSIDIQLTLIATGAPRANGQIERMNRTLTPMLAKLTTDAKHWDDVLPQVEYCFNNTMNRSVGETPSKLLFGIDQLGETSDNLRILLENYSEPERNLETIREKAAVQTEKVQSQNKNYYDKRHKPALEYKPGDYVMISNFDVTPGVNKKLIPKFRGPYEIKTKLPNDRYVVADIEGFQNTQIPYNGIIDASRLRSYEKVLPDK